MATEVTTLPAITRTKETKGAARAARREGNVPCVIYGDKKTPALIAVEAKLLVPSRDGRQNWSAAPPLLTEPILRISEKQSALSLFG